MAVDVRSEVVVTSGDIAQALFSKVQQDLVTQHAALVAEHARVFGELEKFAQKWLLERVREACFSKEWTDAESWIVHTNRFLGLTVTLEPAIDGFGLGEQDRRWSFVTRLLGIQYWKDTVQWTALDPEHSFEVTAEFVCGDPEEGSYEGLVFGRPNFPIGNFVAPAFCEELNAKYKDVRALDQEIRRIKALIDGTKSETTGLSVHEQIQAAVTMQAVNTVPQLRAAFDIDVLAVGVKQLLLPNNAG